MIIAKRLCETWVNLVIINLCKKVIEELIRELNATKLQRTKRH